MSDSHESDDDNSAVQPTVEIEEESTKQGTRGDSPPLNVGGRIDNYFIDGVEEGDEIAIMEKHQKPCPEVSANFLSRFTFWWFNPLMLLGYKKALEIHDLYLLRDKDLAQNVGSEFVSQWKIESKKQKPSLLKALHRSFGTPFYLAGIIKVFYDITQLASPVFLRWLIEFVADPEMDSYIGYLYAIGLTIMNVIGLILVHQYFHIVMRQGMNVCCTFIIILTYTSSQLD
jgi:ATP-binding cassette subfamily C (CFTR/MRP) protein 1